MEAAAHGDDLAEQPHELLHDAGLEAGVPEGGGYDHQGEAARHRDEAAEKGRRAASEMAAAWTWDHAARRIAVFVAPGLRLFTLTLQVFSSSSASTCINPSVANLEAA